MIHEIKIASVYAREYAGKGREDSLTHFYQKRWNKGWEWMRESDLKEQFILSENFDSKKGKRPEYTYLFHKQAGPLECQVAVTEYYLDTLRIEAPDRAQAEETARKILNSHSCPKGTIFLGRSITSRPSLNEIATDWMVAHDPHDRIPEEIMEHCGGYETAERLVAKGMERPESVGRSALLHDIVRDNVRRAMTAWEGLQPWKNRDTLHIVSADGSQSEAIANAVSERFKDRVMTAWNGSETLVDVYDGNTDAIKDYADRQWPGTVTWQEGNFRNLLMENLVTLELPDGQRCIGWMDAKGQLPTTRMRSALPAYAWNEKEHCLLNPRCQQTTGTVFRTFQTPDFHDKDRLNAVTIPFVWTAGTLRTENEGLRTFLLMGQDEGIIRHVQKAEDAPLFDFLEEMAQPPELGVIGEHYKLLCREALAEKNGKNREESTDEERGFGLHR